MNKEKRKELKRRRIRAKISGSGKIPRFSVSVSLSHIRAQIIDDEKGVTICAADDLSINKKITKSEKAKEVGTKIAILAKEKGVKKVVFDRGYRLYHGRLKALAEAAKKEGLIF